MRGDVAERHGRADRGARARVAVAHHRRARVARRVQPRDRGAVLAEHPGAGVGAQPALGAQVAGHDPGRVERRPGQRGQVRVGLAARVAVVPVVRRLTPAELLVPPRRGELVEPGHGLDQPSGRHAGGDGQPGQVVGADHRPGRVPAAWQRPARRQAREHVPVAVPLVEDQPGRDVRVLRGVPVVHGVHRVDVRRRLVDEPLARPVDQEAARQAAFGQAEVRAAGQRDRRPPPGVVHQPGRRAQGQAGQDPVAGVPWRPGRPLRAGRLALVPAAHLLVALEPPGRDQHPEPGPDGHRLAVPCDVDPGYPPVPDLQPGHRGVQPDRHAAAHQPGPQPGGQRLPQAEHPVPGHPAPRGSPRDPRPGQDRARMPRPQAQPPVVGLGDGHPVRGRQVGPGQAGQLGAQPAAVHRHRLHAAPAGQPAGRLGVVVGVARHPRQPQRGPGQHQVEHGRAVLEERLPQPGRHVGARHVRQVGAGLIRRVGHPGGPQHRVARGPDPAPRPRRRPAERPGLLDHHDAQPEVRRGERGRHPRRSAARHHHVELGGPCLGGPCRHAASRPILEHVTVLRRSTGGPVPPGWDVDWDVEADVVVVGFASRGRLRGPGGGRRALPARC